MLSLLRDIWPETISTNKWREETIKRTPGFALPKGTFFNRKEALSEEGLIKSSNATTNHKKRKKTPYKPRGKKITHKITEKGLGILAKTEKIKELSKLTEFNFETIITKFWDATEKTKKKHPNLVRKISTFKGTPTPDPMITATNYAALKSKDQIVRKAVIWSEFHNERFAQGMAQIFEGKSNKYASDFIGGILNALYHKRDRLQNISDSLISKADLTRNPEIFTYLTSLLVDHWLSSLEMMVNGKTKSITSSLIFFDKQKNMFCKVPEKIKSEFNQIIKEQAQPLLEKNWSIKKE